MKKYTALVAAVYGDGIIEGTIWVGHVDAVDTGSACAIALKDCAAEWDLDDEDDSIEVIGLFEGSMQAVYWSPNF